MKDELRVFLRPVFARPALRAALMATTLLGAGAAQAQTAGTDADAAVEIVAEVADEAVALDPILVEGASYETEGTDSYATDLISVGEKDALSPREIPQSTVVMTRQRLEDGNFGSLDQVVRKTPGLLSLNNNDGRSSLYSRGFEFDKLYFNGLPAPLSSIYGTQPDMAIVDHVEVLRGPSGLYGGFGEPAGAINMRLKQAQREFGAKGSVSYGSRNDVRTEADVTGSLVEGGAVRGRLVGAWEDTDSWVDDVEEETFVGYGTLAADLTEDTTLTVSLSHMVRDMVPFNGLPTYSDGTLIDIDRSTFTGADWNDFDNSVTDYMVELEHHFEDGGHAKVSARYSDRDVDFLYGWASAAAGADGSVAGMSWLARDFTEKSLALDAHVSKPFDVFGLEQNVILGVDYQKIDSELMQGRGRFNYANNLYDWDTGAPEPTVAYSTQTDTDASQLGAYGQLRVKPWEPLTLIGGGRFSWYEAETTNLLTGAKSDEVDLDAEFTPYAGAILDLNDWASAYVSYTEIFQPQTEIDTATNELLDPRIGHQYEVGLKAEIPDTNLNAQIAYFYLRDENRAYTDPDTADVSALGEVESQGVEVELSGEILPNWQIAGGYTYTKTKNLTGASAGTAFSPITPEHMVQLWTKYSFDESFGVLDGAFVMGGLTVFSDFSNGSIDAEGYEVVDLGAGYALTDNVGLSLTVNNVFDEEYYARVGGTSVFNFYGAPRSATLKLSVEY